MLSKGEKTRADIVEVAKNLFYEHGFDGTSFSQIVEASGLHRGNIYHYFKTKDEILHAVIDLRLDEFRQVLDQWNTRYTEPRERLHAFVAMIAGNKTGLVNYGCPIGTLNTELGKDRRDLQKSARGLFDLFRDWLAERFAELGHKKDAEPLALHLLGRAQGIAVIAHVYHDPKLLQHEIRQLQLWIDELS